MTKNIQIDGTKITDWPSFHDYFFTILSFPPFYGRNMNAWIDLMTYMDKPDDDFCCERIAKGEVLVLCVSDASDLKQRCPEIYTALVECSAFVNYRRIKAGEQAVLALSFDT